MEESVLPFDLIRMDLVLRLGEHTIDGERIQKLRGSGQQARKRTGTDARTREGGLAFLRAVTDAFGKTGIVVSPEINNTAKK